MHRRTLWTLYAGNLLTATGLWFFLPLLPILLTQTIILFQDTSLVYVISATDLLGAATKIAQRDGRLVEMYLTVGAIYFIICYAASQLVKQLQGRLSYGAR